ncbi:hypothetical protein [Streptomyces muensis]|uniref:Uncharacterized protein n=1 Tax=Streptomyces muensis TaxID=1077944 RepID=A0A9X1TJA9_STRM4|nr:hypothetical protein [Streptomyces muensis]MCF1592404.1 hypothetical protein [Streptomyces muensis]
MPQDSRARTRAIREVMAATGLSYNKAALQLDAENAPATADAAGDVQLHVLPFVFSATVPADVDRRELAQALADELHTLRRVGEEYPGRADVVVPAPVWEPEPHLAGYVHATLIVHAWAVRPWQREGEAEAVMRDFNAVAKAWLLARYPVPVEGHPVAMMLGSARAQALAAEFTAHTGGDHEDLPDGWAELIAARRAKVAATTVEPPEPMVLPEMVPNAPGGADKTSAVVSLPLPAHRPVDVDSAPPRPYRVVDRECQGWYRRSGDGRYDADRGYNRDLETTAYEDLEAARGPLRPVEPPTDEECAAVKTALVNAGRKAAASLLVALYRLVYVDSQLERTGGPRYRVMAGREGSWETDLMVRLAWDIGADLAERPKRYDEAAVAELVRVVDIWIAGPGRYTEVAANLAWLFSSVADEAGGWAAVADRYLQPGDRFGHPEHVVESVQRLLMSQSAHHEFM